CNYEFPERKLPAEAELAQQLGISRTVLRDVLSSIETLGFITRKRGVGTIINEHIIAAKPRLDIDLIVEKAIAEAGYESEMIHVDLQIIPATTQVAERLSIPVGTRIVRVERLFSAQGQPAVYIVQCFLESLLNGPYLFEEFHRSVLEFFAKRCDIQIDTNLSIVKPLLAEDTLAAKMRITPGTLLLYLDEIDYDQHKQPVLWTEEYFVSDLIEFKMMRQKI
ncbi:MAG: GntR family transcriptional regulator, partial [Culicoidibacterales bacterium]